MNQCALICGACGLDIHTPRDDGLWAEGDYVDCGCGAVNVIGVDGSEEDSPCGGPYVAGWHCAHGEDEYTVCEDCDGDEA